MIKKYKLKFEITLDFNRLTRNLAEVTGYISKEEQLRIDNFLINLEELKTKYGFPIEEISYNIVEEVKKNYKTFERSGKMGSYFKVSRTYDNRKKVRK